MDKKLLGQYIKVYREKKGYTQEEFAEIINVATGTIGCYERGEKSPGRDKLFEIARVLELSLDALIFQTNKIDKNIFSDEYSIKFNKLTISEQKIAIKAAEAVIDALLEK